MSRRGDVWRSLWTGIWVQSEQKEIAGGLSVRRKIGSPLVCSCESPYQQNHNKNSHAASDWVFRECGEFQKIFKCALGERIQFMGIEPEYQKLNYDNRNLKETQEKESKELRALKKHINSASGVDTERLSKNLSVQMMKTLSRTKNGIHLKVQDSGQHYHRELSRINKN